MMTLTSWPRALRLVRAARTITGHARRPAGLDGRLAAPKGVLA